VTPRLNAISGEHGEERPDVACLLRAGEVEEAVHLVVGFLFGLGAAWLLARAEQITPQEE